MKLLFATSLLARGPPVGLRFAGTSAGARPRRAASGASRAAGSNGTLLVFSAFRHGADFNGPPYRRPYTDYKILSADGNLLQSVRNDGGPWWRHRSVWNCRWAPTVLLPGRMATGWSLSRW